MTQKKDYVKQKIKQNLNLTHPENMIIITVLMHTKISLLISY